MSHQYKACLRFQLFPKSDMFKCPCMLIFFLFLLPLLRNASGILFEIEYNKKSVQ